eukprot:TRINITY_DN17670_c0_g1_i1.p1 TRINITY_DN17670_c0_g1~~TRINITY_DN17670_c0_g1_i1.p1  ORF type:complete len:309 (-),score=71.29 TRINITY_DN17670_c0_g1_i1:43-969(-)
MSNEGDDDVSQFPGTIPTELRNKIEEMVSLEEVLKSATDPQDPRYQQASTRYTALMNELGLSDLKKTPFWDEIPSEPKKKTWSIKDMFFPGRQKEKPQVDGEDEDLYDLLYTDPKQFYGGHDLEVPYDDTTSEEYKRRVDLTIHKNLLMEDFPQCAVPIMDWYTIQFYRGPRLQHTPAEVNMKWCFLSAFCPREADAFFSCMGGVPGVGEHFGRGKFTEEGTADQEEVVIPQRCLEKWARFDGCLRKRTGAIARGALDFGDTPWSPGRAGPLTPNPASQRHTLYPTSKENSTSAGSTEGPKAPLDKMD